MRCWNGEAQVLFNLDCCKSRSDAMAGEHHALDQQ